MVRSVISGCVSNKGHRSIDWEPLKSAVSNLWVATGFLSVAICRLKIFTIMQICSAKFVLLHINAFNTNPKQRICKMISIHSHKYSLLILFQQLARQNNIQQVTVSCSSKFPLRLVANFTRCPDAYLSTRQHWFVNRGVG